MSQIKVHYKDCTPEDIECLIRVVKPRPAASQREICLTGDGFINVQPAMVDRIKADSQQ